MQSKVGEVRKFPPIINCYIEWSKRNIFQRGKVTFPDFFSVEIFILVHPKQISVVSKVTSPKKVLCSFSYLPHSKFLSLLFYNFPSFPFHFPFSLPLFFLFPPLFPSPIHFSSIPLPKFPQNSVPAKATILSLINAPPLINAP